MTGIAAVLIDVVCENAQRELLLLRDFHDKRKAKLDHVSTTAAHGCIQIIAAVIVRGFVIVVASIRRIHLGRAGSSAVEQRVVGSSRRIDLDSSRRSRGSRGGGRYRLHVQGIGARSRAQIGSYVVGRVRSALIGKAEIAAVTAPVIVRGQMLSAGIQ